MATGDQPPPPGARPHPEPVDAPPPPDPPPAPPAAPVRPRLERPRDERLLFGVCSGLARYLGVEAALVRIVVVLLTVLGGSGLLLYLLGLVLIPAERPRGTAPPAPPNSFATGPATTVGAALVGLGVVLLAREVVPGFAQLSGPVLLIALGAGLLLVARR